MAAAKHHGFEPGGHRDDPAGLLHAQGRARPRPGRGAGLAVRDQRGFDPFLVGLTATPSQQTLGFFNKNLVMEYDHERAVAGGVNVDFEVYQIRTKITEGGCSVEAHPDTMLGYRNRQTRALRWEKPDEDLTYDPNEQDRRVVAKDQIRTIIRTFCDKLPVDIFPGRKEVPKTLIFAKDDSHAEDIVEIVRDEFGRGNPFCQKTTYKCAAWSTTGSDGTALPQLVAPASRRRDYRLSKEQGTSLSND